MPQVLREMLRVVRESRDRKLGYMAATYRPVGPTCPSDCPLLGNGCYAQRGLVNFAQLKTNRHSGSLDKAAGVDMIRHHVSGDVFTDDQLDVEYVNEIFDFHLQNGRTKGALYTHRISDWQEAGFTPTEVPKNLQVLASCDSPDGRREAKALGWRTARTITHPDLVEKGERLCPYDVAKFKKIKPIPVTCRSCQLCWKANGPDIAFVKF